MLPERLPDGLHERRVRSRHGCEHATVETVLEDPEVDIRRRARAVRHPERFDRSARKTGRLVQCNACIPAVDARTALCDFASDDEVVYKDRVEEIAGLHGLPDAGLVDPEVQMETLETRM